MKNFRNGMAAAAMAVAAFACNNAAFADDVQASAGISVGNAQCGVYEVTASASVDRDSDVRPYHLNVQVGPNGGCNGQGVSFDASFAQRWGVVESVYGVVTAGFDRQTVAFEYVGGPASFKHFHGVAVDTPTLSFGFGRPVGDWTVELAYNAVETQLATGKNISPLVASASGEVLGFEVDVVLRPKGIAELDVTRSVGNVSYALRGSYNGSKLMHDAPAEIDGLMRAGIAEPSGRRIRRVGVLRT